MMKFFLSNLVWLCWTYDDPIGLFQVDLNWIWSLTFICSFYFMHYFNSKKYQKYVWPFLTSKFHFTFVYHWLMMIPFNIFCEFSLFWLFLINLKYFPILKNAKNIFLTSLNDDESMKNILINFLIDLRFIWDFSPIMLFFLHF